MATEPTPLFVSVRIRASMDRVWELTQDPELHARWDARFTTITPTATHADGVTRFTYRLKLPGHTIKGTGATIGERSRPDGTRTSALGFDTSDPLSPLGAGRGYWRYRPDGDDVVFTTGYDYAPAWGGTLDRLIVRPFVGWLTAWSFDRLRIWAEEGLPPERWGMGSVLMVWRRQRPRARRCERHAPRRRVMDDAPETMPRLVVS